MQVKEKAWRWNEEIGDYIQDDPGYPEGVQTSELERMRFNDELAEKTSAGTISWEEFGIQKKAKHEDASSKGVNYDVDTELKNKL